MGICKNDQRENEGLVEVDFGAAFYRGWLDSLRRRHCEVKVFDWTQNFVDSADGSAVVFGGTDLLVEHGDVFDERLVNHMSRSGMTEFTEFYLIDRARFQLARVVVWGDG